MTRPPSEIEREINQVRDEANQRLARLGRALDKARRYEAIAASSHERARETTRRVLSRFESGWWIAGAPRLWWHRPGQALVERAAADEMEAVRRLMASGILESGENGRLA